jgi:lysozyme
MKTARDIIKKHEGLRLVAYPDPGTRGAPWTIGYGHTHNVRKGDTCTVEQAEAWLDTDMAGAYAIVDAAVKVSLTRQQRDALCSFVFNVGPGYKNVKDGFVQLKNGNPSTMLRRLNAGDYVGAATQFPLWNKAAGRVLRGLTIRRGEERALFLSGTGIQPAAISFIEETPVAPFLVAAIPALIQALPDFARIFKSPDVAERNVEAVTKAAGIVMDAVGASNIQEAVEKVQADPELADAANHAMRMSHTDLIDLIERMSKMDEASVGAAREFSRQDKPVFGSWLFVHLLSMLFVVLGGGAAIYVLVASADPTERVMALQTLLIVGFASVASFWLGSSRSSQVKDLTRESEGR